MNIKNFDTRDGASLLVDLEQGKVINVAKGLLDSGSERGDKDFYLNLKDVLWRLPVCRKRELKKVCPNDEILRKAFNDFFEFYLKKLEEEWKF